LFSEIVQPFDNIGSESQKAQPRSPPLSGNALAPQSEAFRFLLLKKGIELAQRGYHPFHPRALFPLEGTVLTLVRLHRVDPKVPKRSFYFAPGILGE